MRVFIPFTVIAILVCVGSLYCQTQVPPSTTRPSTSPSQVSTSPSQVSTSPSQVSTSPSQHPVSPPQVTPLEILERIDSNITSSAKSTLSRMIVYNRRGKKREMKMRSWVVGDERAFSEYLAPRKEKGTKVLKEGKNIWTYTPRADRIIHIAGHLLRQPIMGSDLSYEDSLEEVELSKAYAPVSTTEDQFDGRPVWIMKIQAKDTNVAYDTKKLWVDKERFLPLKQEWFGKSGKLLKTATIQKVKRIDDRWYPVNVLFKDELARGSGTQFIIDEIDFDVPIPPRLFSKQSLRK